MWPHVVKTTRKFNRPQHSITDCWKRFTTPLKLRPDVDLTKIEPNEYGLVLTQIRETKDKELLKILEETKSE
jgi:hypothetical protein